METPWLQQGDVFKLITRVPVLGVDGQPAHVASPLGVVVVSQTCDNARSAHVQVSPLVQLEGTDFSNAAAGRTAKFAPVPGVGPGAFASLEMVATISKSLLRESDRMPGVSTLIERRALAMAIARRYERFAFPDEIVRWLGPLRNTVQKKARQPESAEGKAFERVRQIRIRSDTGWADAPYVLGFTFILDAGELPFESEILPDAQLAQWLVGKSSNQIAERLSKGKIDEQSALLHALCESWVGRCCVGDGASEAVVSDYSVELATEDEYTVAAYWDSEALDLDHLSGPTF